MFNWIRVFCVLSAFVASACVITGGGNNTPANGDYYGSQYYDVSEPDYIYDAFGYQAIADCVGRIQFTGWFDSSCDALISSEYRSATLLCGYYDIYSSYYEYYETFSFPAGYISEYCSSTGRKKQGLGSSDNIDPTTQPVVNDDLMHAAVEKRKGPFSVKQNLGKNVKIDEFMSTKYPNGLKRERTPGTSIERQFTREEFNASQK